MVDSDEERFNFEILKAHDDDVHGLEVEQYEGKPCIISGGKDGNIKCWDYFGKLNHYLLSKDEINYKQWITSLSCFKNGYTIGGTREGSILIYNEDHKFIKKFHYNKKSTDNYYCKENNQKRILCTAFDNISGIKTDGSFNFYVGTPKYLHVYNNKQGKIHTFTETEPENKSDWVYCFEKLEEFENKYFMVLGPYLKLWEINNSNFNKATNVEVDEIINDRMLNKKEERQSQYISDITESSQNTVIGAFFDGTIREIDFETGKFVSIQQQHQGRVWRVLKMHGMLISSADDGKVNFYDEKSLKMISEIDNFDGRVSELQELDEWNLLTSSCPDDLSESQHRAVIACWDIRKLLDKSENRKEAEQEDESVEFENEELLQEMQQLKIEENEENTNQ